MTLAGYGLVGLCYSGDCLYLAEVRWESDRVSYSLAVYRVDIYSRHFTWLDRLTGLGTDYLPRSLCPRMDHHSRRVFIPSHDSGVTVVRLDGDRLVRERTLTCVRNAISVDVMSPDTIYVGDRYSCSVCVVNVRDDNITSTLETPDAVRDERPYRLAVLGDSVMVGYGASTLVVYRHGSTVPARVIPRPGGLEDMYAISTGCQGNFIMTDRKTKAVFAVDVSGKLCHTENLGTGTWPMDCAEVNKQLWVGCSNGDIVIR